MYQQLLYGASIFSFESDYTCASPTPGAAPIVGPIGFIQQAGNVWVNAQQEQKNQSTPGPGIGTHITQVPLDSRQSSLLECYRHVASAL